MLAQVLSGVKTMWTTCEILEHWLTQKEFEQCWAKENMLQKDGRSVHIGADTELKGIPEVANTTTMRRRLCFFSGRIQRRCWYYSIDAVGGFVCSYSIFTVFFARHLRLLETSCNAARGRGYSVSQLSAFLRQVLQDSTPFLRFLNKCYSVLLFLRFLNRCCSILRLLRGTCG